jgi:hypothetical protein
LFPDLFGTEFQHQLTGNQTWINSFLDGCTFPGATDALTNLIPSYTIESEVYPMARKHTSQGEAFAQVLAEVSPNW